VRARLRDWLDRGGITREGAEGKEGGGGGMGGIEAKWEEKGIIERG